MPEYQLCQVAGADMPTRYSANGKRISRDKYERITAAAFRDGKLECFHTKAKQLPGGRIRRWNYISARW